VVDWKNSTLGELVRIGKGVIQTGPFGSQLHVSDYVNTGIPILMPVNLKNNKIDVSKVSYISEEDAERLSKHIVRAGDIIYSRRGDVTQKALITEKEKGFFCGTGCLLIRVGDSIDSNFLVYFLTTSRSKSWIVNNAVGITMPNLNTKILGKFPISFPGLKKQKQIAKVLSDLDAKIEINNKIILELEAMATLIYDYWFVQFDFPFDFAQGKPDPNGQPYKSSGGKMVYNEELKRDIPDEWEVEALNEHLVYNSGFSFSSMLYSSQGKWKIVTIKSVQTNGLDTSKSDKIVELPDNIDNACILEVGNLLMSLTGNTGRLCFVEEENCLLNQRVGKIWSPKFSNFFLYLFFNRPEQQKLIEKLSSGSSQANLSPIQLFKSKMVIPNDNSLKQFIKITKPIFEKFLLHKKENQKLSKLRDWLLPLLMNGQVTVGEAEERLGTDSYRQVAEEGETYKTK
jgi:type I restriction enzyme S subunit